MVQYSCPKEETGTYDADEMRLRENIAVDLIEEGVTIVAVRICGQYKARPRFQTSSGIIELFVDTKASVFLICFR